MQELEKRIGLLRILLADVISKQEQLAGMEKQYRAQLDRIVEFVVHREGDVANALSLMSEVQVKLDEVLRTSGHLGMISERANIELEVLVLTKRVAEARSQLAALEERHRELTTRLAHITSGEETHISIEASQVEELRAISDEVATEMIRLNNLITEASERAAHTIHSTAKSQP